MIVEDQVLIAEYFRIVVEQCGYEVCGIARTAREGSPWPGRKTPRSC
jgi:hypothetical protein